MATINIFDILSLTYGPKGLPFPKRPDIKTGSPIAQAEFTGFSYADNNKSKKGSNLYSQNSLGQPVFLPATLAGSFNAGGQTFPFNYELPNPLITITGEKSIIETDVVDVGTVFEKVFTRPYDITIICTLINADDTWPEQDIERFKELFAAGDLYTLRCPLTDIFLQTKNNFLLTKISVLDMGQCENAQVIQLDGRSNIDFELIIK